MNTVHSLDDGIQEYFEFTVKGHTYQFRYLNTEEMDQMKKKTAEDIQTFLYQFITSKDEGAPAFPEVAKTMIVPQWKRFMDMIVSEFNGSM